MKLDHLFIGTVVESLRFGTVYKCTEYFNLLTCYANGGSVVCQETSNYVFRDSFQSNSCVTSDISVSCR